MAEVFRTLVRRGIEAGHFRPLRPESVQAQLHGAILASLCSEGWDEAGRPIAGVPVEEIVRESQDLAVRLLGVSED
jgi:hypothetical protein